MVMPAIMKADMPNMRFIVVSVPKLGDVGELRGWFDVAVRVEIEDEDEVGK